MNGLGWTHDLVFIDRGFIGVATVTSEIAKTSQDPEGLTPLAHARALVESSIGTRDNIVDLLNRVDTANGAKPEE